MYMPEAAGSEVYFRSPLHHTGTHDVLPFVKVPKEGDPDPIKYGRI